MQTCIFKSRALYLEPALYGAFHFWIYRVNKLSLLVSYLVLLNVIVTSLWRNYAKHIEYRVLASKNFGLLLKLFFLDIQFWSRSVNVIKSTVVFEGCRSQPHARCSKLLDYCCKGWKKKIDETLLQSLYSKITDLLLKGWSEQMDAFHASSRSPRQRSTPWRI